MRLMYDAVDLTQVPAAAKLVGVYVDGQYAAPPGALLRFPGALLVRIAVDPATNDGHVFDGPPDNASWPAVVNWVLMRRRAGADPSVYTDLDQWGVGRAAFQQAGVREPYWWIASWDGVASIPAGAVAHQYANVHGAYDLSAVADYWPGVDPTPGGAPAPAPGTGASQSASLMEDPVLLMYVQGDQANPSPGIWLLSGDLYAHVPNGSDVDALQGVGVNHASISYAMHTAIQQGAAALHGTLSGSLGVSGSLNVS